MCSSDLEQPGVQLCCPTPIISPDERYVGVVHTPYVNLVYRQCLSAYSCIVVFKFPFPSNSYDDEADLHNDPGTSKCKTKIS